MAYASYQFYTDEYRGKVIPTYDDFNSAVTQASAYLDYIVRGSIEPTEKVKMAACAVAEVIFKQTETSNIASESVGNHSRTYITKTQKDLDREKYRAANIYLWNTGLLYRGLR